MAKGDAGQRMARALAIVRDGILITVLSLGVLLGLELAYRGQASIRAAFREPAPAGPIDVHPWGAEVLAEEAEVALSWSPYVHFRPNARQGVHMNVDSDGRRRTVHPVPPASPPPLRVYLFGGSTAFGTGQRDEGTLASALAARFTSGGYPGLEVVNFGASGWVFTQGVMELALRLRAGERPDVVIFYDGINEVIAAAQSGVPGFPQNEANRMRDFEMGRAVFNWEWGWVAEGDALRHLGGGLVSRLHLVRRLQEAVGQGPPGLVAEGFDAGMLGPELTRSYAATARIADALAREYGFRALYVWQPTIHTTGKALTPWEAGLLESMQVSPDHGPHIQLHRAVLPGIRSTMTAQVGDRFLDLSTVLDTVRADVYLDRIGHTTEEANFIIAEAMWGRLFGSAGPPILAGSGPPPASATAPALRGVGTSR